MSSMGMSHWAQAALILFLLVFVGIVVHVFSKKNTSAWDRARSMPLADDGNQSDESGRSDG
jgi:cbb3-type cytochrome oxidase subunit 3